MNFDIKNIDWQLVQQITFFVFASTTIGGAVYVLLTKNVLHAIFALLLTFMGVAGLFVFAGADFLAVSQIMIYVGGILILLIFGIMLTRKKADLMLKTNTNEILVGQKHQFWAILAAIMIFLIFLKIIFQANFLIVGKLIAPQSTVNSIGIKLMTDYAFAFEILGILLLIALVGSTYIARKEKK